MRRRANQKKLIPLVLALLATMVGAALAVPQFGVNVQNLGQGEGTISTTVHTASVDFTLSSDGTQITGVKVKIVDSSNNPVTTGTVYVQLLDDNGNILAEGYGSPDSNGIVTVTFSSGVAVQGGSGVSKVAVTYQGQPITS